MSKSNLATPAEAKSDDAKVEAAAAEAKSDDAEFTVQEQVNMMHAALLRSIGAYGPCYRKQVALARAAKASGK